MVERGVAGHAEDSGAKGHLALLVLADDPHQLGEEVLGGVLGLVVVAHMLLTNP